MAGFMEYAVVVNRTSAPVEMIYDGQVLVLKPRERRPVPVELAQHVFTLDKLGAFDAGGQRVRTVGLAEAPDWLKALVDPACLVCDAVELGHQPSYRADLIAEGTAVVPRHVPGSNPQELHESQGVPAEAGFKALA